MPGPNIHISAMRHAAANLAGQQFQPIGSDRINPEWTGLDTQKLGQILKQNPNFASLGAIGPDFFYFLPDFRDENGIRISSDLIAILNFLETLYDTLDPYISKWEHYLGPIGEDTAEEMSRLTGGLSETVGDITGELGSILITALEDFVVKQWDLMGFFSLGLNKGYDEQAFFWSDMLHYRETGQFARALWEEADASKNDGARAYALGYMTHIGVDVTGHSFVNTISGGPFRLHWDRHHLVENHMDAYWYLQDPMSPRNGDQYPQLTESALYFDIAFGDSGSVKNRPGYPSGKTLRDNWVRRRKLDIDSEIPDPIPDILINSMNNIFYQDGKHPKILRDNNGRPSADLIREAYKLLFRFFKYTTVDGFAHEPPEPPAVFPNLKFPTIKDPNEEPPGEDGGEGHHGSFWDDALDFILAVVRAIGYALEVAAYLATLPWAVLADIVTYPLRLGLYYAMELPLFHILKAFRSVLVMTGYMLPMEDEIIPSLNHIRSTNTSIFGDIGDIFGGLLPPDEPGSVQTFRDPEYPHVQPEDESDGSRHSNEFRHPWQYPDGAKTELCPTTSGPYADGAGPDILFKDIRTDPRIRDALESAINSDLADTAGLLLTPNNHLGDAISFSEYFIWLETRSQTQKDERQVQLVDWNLDSDRGYGYHCWDWNRDSNLPATKDPEGNMFQGPCTWPQQSEPWDRTDPRQLHWTGKGIDEPTNCSPHHQPCKKQDVGPIDLKRPAGPRKSQEEKE